ncbi:hypothetical protein SAMN05443575_3330 [Jatrophihabitans endophyticus]|uniref:Uncharacterized protein n=1 Tax=Jatrophihabitans endophyticus TaxID=1206085 RepID=A0A1M5Q8A7_9ACTN|nr:hypothetical protein [Jatrophihabitans endophyticus]SHH10404.1 hypothetical protein SAMN05443575_3330 [Jatrophihabitans endophyticus]
MYRVRTSRCACCELELDIPVDVDRPFDAPVCPRCRLHQDDDWVRLVDHTAMLRHVVADARDEADLAHGERDFYRERATVNAKSGEALVRVLTEIDDLHHLRGTRCACGVVECRVMELLSDPAVARLIGTYDEQRHTLFELRRANPGAWAEEWDDIDVTLVYPQRARRAGGRHRAAG